MNPVSKVVWDGGAWSFRGRVYIPDPWQATCPNCGKVLLRAKTRKMAKDRLHNHLTGTYKTFYWDHAHRKKWHRVGSGEVCPKAGA